MNNGTNMILSYSLSISVLGFTEGKGALLTKVLLMI
jgi:hypothetical protein